MGARTYRFEYPHPAVTVDCVVFGLDEGELKVLLIERGLPPFKGRWALPGGFVGMDEGLEEAARRELEEESGLRLAHIEQLGAFGEPGRDPRERVVTVAHWAIVKSSEHMPRGASDARRAAWFAVAGLPLLAFDHRAILDSALGRLREGVRRAPIGFEFLPRRFSLGQLQALYEAVLGRGLDKRNFRKKILATGLLVALEERETNVAHRAARLYRFDARTYARLREAGFIFNI